MLPTFAAPALSAMQGRKVLVPASVPKRKM